MKAKTAFSAVMLIFLLLTGCKKEDKPVYSGTMTIDNVLSETIPYYGYGFYVPTGKKISTNSASYDLITINSDPVVLPNTSKMYMLCNYNPGKEPFYLYGKYQNSALAVDAFDQLVSFNSPAWSGIADSVSANQIWLFRTSTGSYAKIRVIGTFTETRQGMPFPYAECTFEWVYQPDGSQTFPSK